MYESLALIALLAWPLVPIFLLTLHPFIKFWRKIGAAYYFVPLILWALAANMIYSNRTLLLKEVIDVGILSWLGVALMLAGMALHAWASALIGIKGTFGWTELFPPKKSKFVVAGPYKYVRHPIYLAHSLMFFGVFFMTGVISTAVAAVLDFLLSYFVIAPLEEKELRERFGETYEDYAKKAGKFLPVG